MAEHSSDRAGAHAPSRADIGSVLSSSSSLVSEEPTLALLERLGIPVDAHAQGEPQGRAFSLEPNTGDPRFVAVLPDGELVPFWIDRRTMRAARTPRDSQATEQDVVRAADLADRVQLALGTPALVHFGFADEKVHVTHVERGYATLQFTPTTYRCVAPFIADKRTLAPLSVDALDRALRVEEDRGDEHRVRAVFGRAYRKVDAYHTPWSRGSRGRLGSAQRLVRLGRDVTLALADARRFRYALAQSIARHDAEELTQLDAQDLIETLRQRMSMVVSALVLLERARMATLSLLPALRQLSGGLLREDFLALAAPSYTPERVVIERKLLDLLHVCDEGPDRALSKPTSGPVLAEWTRLRRTLRHVRLLGMDVRLGAIGESDSQLLHTLHTLRAQRAEGHELERARAARQVVLRGLGGQLGPLGLAPVALLLKLMARLAEAKGSVADGLSAALLRLRAAALEAGRRLSSEGTVEYADDTLYMSLEEIEQALEGELGAYAARARLRREDDRRWRNFDAPRVLAARLKP